MDRSRMAMCLDQFALWKSRIDLQAVDVLSNWLQKLFFVVRFLDEFVGNSWGYLSREELFGELIEGLRIAFEKFDIKHRFRLREVIFLQSTIKTWAWASKVRNSCWDADTCSCQENNLFHSFVFYILNKLLFRIFLLLFGLLQKWFLLVFLINL